MFRTIWFDTSWNLKPENFVFVKSSKVNQQLRIQQEKMNLFSGNGLLYKDPEDLFRESSWVQVMIGQGLMPKSYHAMANRISSEQLNGFLSDVQKLIERPTADLPSHQDFIERHCKADLQ